MSRPLPIFPKLEVPHHGTDLSSAPNSMGQYSGLRPSPFAADSNLQHQIYRTKRKHVLKACDRCRVKKTKCDGNQPCHRCSAYNHPCLFRERKAMQTKAYSKGFVEMLESHHALVVKALQQLYTHCVNNECFPGEPIEVVDGYPLTHAILERMGLIKQAENEPEKLDAVSLGMPQFWDQSRRSSTSVGSNDSWPDSSCEQETSISSTTPSSPDKQEFGVAEPERSPDTVHHAYSGYPCGKQVWHVDEQPAAAATIDLNQAGRATTKCYGERGPASNRLTKSTNILEAPNRNFLPHQKQNNVAAPGFFSHPENNSVYANLPQHPFHEMGYQFADMGQHYAWNIGPWSQ